MKFLQNMIEKQAPLYKKGGKLEKLFPLYEAGDTFIFTPGSRTKGAPHVRDPLDLKRYMISVIFALMPAILFGIWNTGNQFNTVNQVENATFITDIIQGLIQVVPVIFVSYAVGGLWEVLFAVVRKHEINEGFLVSGMLFPLTLPPTIPLWQVAVGISFGIVIGKEIFGGVGFNILNPALTARAFLYFAYPSQISGDGVWTKIKDGATLVDSYTGATPLAVSAGTVPGENVLQQLTEAGYSWGQMAVGTIAGSIGETSAVACLLGLIFLIATGVSSWRISLSGIAGLAAGSLLVNAFAGPEVSPFLAVPFHYHLVMGSFMFGIVYMATDPVSSAATNTGKIIYGFMIGFLTLLIRVVNPAFAEGVMLAILFMNVMAPMIDHYVVQAHIKRRNRYA